MQEDKPLNDPCGIPESPSIVKGNSRVGWAVLLLVLVITLVAGLLPRGSFKDNWLAWDQLSSRTEFGAFGIVHGEFPDLSEILDQNRQLIFDLVIVPRTFSGPEFRILLQLDFPDDPNPFIIGQWENLLIVMQGEDFAGKEGLPRLSMDIGEFIGEELSVLVKLNQDKNELFLDGQLVRSWPVNLRARKKKCAHHYWKFA